MKLKEFYKQLDALDWFYQFSDDSKVYDRGERAVREASRLAESMGPSHAALFEAFRAHKFSGPNFGCPPVPKPLNPKE